MSYKITSLFVISILFLSYIFLIISTYKQKTKKVFFRLVIISTPLVHIGIILSTFVSISYVLIVCYILYVAVNCLRHGAIKKLYLYELSLILFVLYIGITLLWGIEWRETTKQFLGFMLAACLVFSLRQDKLGSLQAINAKYDIIIIGVLVSILAFLQMAYGQKFFPGFDQIKNSIRFSNIDEITTLHELGSRSIRSTGTFLNSTACSIFLLFPFCICIDELLKSKKFLYIFPLILICAGILSTFCRVAYGLAILGSLMLCAFYIKHNRISGIFFIVMSALCLIFFLPDYYIHIIKNMFTDTSNSGLKSNIRFSYWLISLSAFKSSPVFGRGYGNIQYAMSRIFEGGNPHSSYLTILLNQGLFGLSLLALFLISSYKKFKTILHRDKYTLRPVFVVFILNLISMMTDTLIYGDFFVYLLPLFFMSIYLSNQSFQPNKFHR